MLFRSATIGLFNRLDDTDGDRLAHVTDGETSEGRVLGERLDALRKLDQLPSTTATTRKLTMGLEGTILTMAASPDLTNLGASSIDLPVRRSIFSRRVSNLQAI